MSRLLLRVRPLAALLVFFLALLVQTPRPAAADVARELTFHRGVAAYGEGRYDDAKKYFETVLAAEPEDAGTLQYLGMIADQQGDKEAAIDYMRRAVAAAPDDLDAREALAAALLSAGRAQEASLHLKALIIEAPDNADAHLFLGIAEYRQQNFRATVEQMEIAARLDPSLRLHARYYTGLSLTFLGDIPSSATAFADAAAISPSNPLSQSASSLHDQILAGDRRWALDVMTGIEYDTNPTLIGQPDLPGFDRDPSILGVFALNGRYNIVDDENVRVRAGYNGYVNLHQQETAKQVDQQTHVGWTSASWIHGRFVAATRYDFAYTFLDLDRNFRELHRITPSLSYLQSDWGTTQLIYQFQAFDFKYDFSAALNPDGHTNKLGLNQFIYLPEPFSYARIGFAGEMARTDGTEYDFDGFEAGAGLGAALPLRISLDLFYRYLYRSYRNPSVFSPEGIARTDNVHRLAVDFRIPLMRHWELSLRGSFNWNESDVEVYDYDRHVVGTYARFIF